jgi:hypothetical protein
MDKYVSRSNSQSDKYYLFEQKPIDRTPTSSKIASIYLSVLKEPGGQTKNFISSSGIHS